MDLVAPGAPAGGADTAVLSSPTPSLPPSTRRPRRWPAVVLVAGFAGCWVVPAVAQLTGLTALLPVLVLAGTALLLRSGRTVLDRLVLAVALLAGASCLAGVVLSFVPFGLAPVVAGGLAGSALLAVAAVRRRTSRPDLRALVRTVRPADVATAAMAAAGAAVLAWPYTVGGLAGRLGMMITGQGLAGEYRLLDGVREGGGYLFLPGRAGHPVVPAGFAARPQGAPMLFALLENARTGATHGGAPLARFDHLIGYSIGGSVFLLVAVLWSVRWLVGPMAARRGGLRFLLPALGLVTGYLVFADPLSILQNGHPAEAIGLGLLAVLLAATARPVGAGRERAVLAGLVLAGIAFTDPALLPVAVGGVLVAAPATRQWLRAHRAVAVAGGIAGAVAGLALMLAAGGYRLAAGEMTARTNRTTVLVLLLLAAVSLMMTRRRRASRITGAQLAVAAGMTGLVYACHAVASVRTADALEQALHLLAVVALLGVAALGPSLRPVLAPDPWAARGRLRAIAGAGTAAVLFAVGGLLFAGPIPYGSSIGVDQLRRRTIITRYDLAFGVLPADAITVPSGRLDLKPGGALLAWSARRLPAAPGRVTVLLVSDDPWSNYAATRYLNALNRVDDAPIAGRYRFAHPMESPAVTVPALTNNALMNAIAASPAPVRLVVADRRGRALFGRFAAAHPALRTEVVDAHALGWR